MEQTYRKIIHVDMDAFYASVEQRDDPALRGKPIAVGGSRERGVVAAASYEARVFGVRSAMPSSTARRKCPELLFVKPRFEVYKAVSQQIRSVFAEYTPLIEPLSLDEAYLDVTDNLKQLASATQIARQIKDAIKEATGLTASAGVSYNKFLAKLASDYRKPDGLFVIKPSQGLAFVETLRVSQFHGIGPATAAKMNQLGIATGLDLRRQTEAFLVRHFGKAGHFYHAIANAIDDRPVRPDRERKSIGSETTFSTDLSDWDDLIDGLHGPIADLWQDCQRLKSTGRTLTVKIKYADFQQITRSRSFGSPIASESQLTYLAHELLQAQMPFPKGVRLLGVSLSNLESTDGTISRSEVGKQLEIGF
ncbi:DNA polymerase IV [Fibrella aestuarina]|uniref:DNA polymerase IV n=2 Tax=Fibrivirga algicola TaxID=2950420 RepID=A0ABX0QD45_9BACT|nr:DNA polymerase IV [Fibrivirga algicola]NID10295.1 DNA polymerase IV [Fibrivirga algicola]